MAFGRWRPLEGDDTTAPVNIGRMSPWEPRMSPWEPRVGCIGRVLDRGVASVWDEMHWTGVAWTEGSVPDVGGSHLIVGNGDSPALARMRSGAASSACRCAHACRSLPSDPFPPPHTVEETNQPAAGPRMRVHGHTCGDMVEECLHLRPSSVHSPRSAVVPPVVTGVSSNADDHDSANLDISRSEKR
mgnify:FL=1